MSVWWLLLSCSSGSLTIPTESGAPPTPPDPADSGLVDTEPGGDSGEAHTDSPPGETGRAHTGEPGGGSSADTAVERVPPAPDPTDALFGDDLVEIHIELDELAWAELMAQSAEAQAIGAEFYDFRYVEGSLEYDGQTYAPVGVRMKGQGSWLAVDEKPSLKVEFDEYDPDLRFVGGLNRITLNNMSNDGTMVHERLAYWAFREVGLMASRAGHAQLVINGEPYGLYTILETVDRDMIRRWSSDEGVLFEAWDVDLKPEYVASFELEFGDEELGRQALRQAAEALDSGLGQAALDAAEPYLDWQQFVRFWATEAVIGQFDSYPYSYPGDDCFVYVDPPDDRIRFLPWGMDETFVDPWRDIDGIYGRVAERCLQSGSCMDRFAEDVWEIHARLVEQDWVGRHDAIVEQVRPAVLADVHKPYDTASVLSSQEDMRSFLADRQDTLAAQLGPPP